MKGRNGWLPQLRLDLWLGRVRLSKPASTSAFYYIQGPTVKETLDWVGCRFPKCVRLPRSGDWQSQS